MKITMKNKKSDGFDELYPETLAENVNFLNGLNLEQYKNEVENRIPDDIPLWEGGEKMLEGVKVKPSKKLTDCPQGWRLMFQRYYEEAGEIANSSYQYYEIPKTHVANAGTGVKIILGSVSNKIVHKYLYIRDDEIEGHGTNNKENNGEIVLSGVFEF